MKMRDSVRELGERDRERWGRWQSLTHRLAQTAQIRKGGPLFESTHVSSHPGTSKSSAMAPERVDGFTLEQRHGKERVRLGRVWRSRGGHHFFVEWVVGISLLSDCLDSYIRDDNSDIVATDSIKNTVISLILLPPAILRSVDDSRARFDVLAFARGFVLC